MSRRVCSVPSCPTLVTKAGKCAEHQREYEQARGTSSQRGYDSVHQRLRAAFQRNMDDGVTYYCWRPECGKPIDPTAWHLGHDDNDRNRYRGPECIPCNTATASRRPT